MKSTLLLLLVVAVMRVEAADADPFAAARLRLEVQTADDVSFVNLGQHDFMTDKLSTNLRLDLPIGPVRLNYGIPIKQDSAGETKSWPPLDAPGLGYREQRARFGQP